MESTNDADCNTKKRATAGRRRFWLGLTILIVGWLSPLLIPFITRTSLATEWKTIISGLLAVGLPEVFTVAAIAIMGKYGYGLVKRRLQAILKRIQKWMTQTP